MLLWYKVLVVQDKKNNIKKNTTKTTKNETTQKTKKMSNTDPTNKLEVNTCTRGGQHMYSWRSTHVLAKGLSSSRFL